MGKEVKEYGLLLLLLLSFFKKQDILQLIHPGSFP